MKLSKINNYGFEGRNINTLIVEIESIFECKLEAHDSIYKGSYWIYKSNDNMKPKHVELSFNCDPQYEEEKDPEGEYYFNLEFKECDILLAFTAEPNYAEFKSQNILKLEGAKLVNSRNYTWKNA